MDFNKITMRIAEDETISHLHTSDDDHPAVDTEFGDACDCTVCYVHCRK